MAQFKISQFKATGERRLPWLASFPALGLVFFLHIAALIPLAVGIYGVYYGATVTGGVSANFGSSQQCLHSALPLLDATCRKWIRGGVVASAVSPWALRASGVVYALLMIAAKWCMLGRIAPGKGISGRSLWWRIRFDLFQTLQAGPLLDIALGLASSTILFPLYLRSLGARCGLRNYISVFQTNAHDLLRIGKNVVIDSGNSAVAISSDAADPVTIDDGASLGNYVWLMPGANAAPAAVLGNAAYLRPGQHVPASSTTMGSQLLRPGHDIETGSLEADVMTQSTTGVSPAAGSVGTASSNAGEASGPCTCRPALHSGLFSSLTLARESVLSPVCSRTFR